MRMMKMDLTRMRMEMTKNSQVKKAMKEGTLKMRLMVKEVMMGMRMMMAMTTATRKMMMTEKMKRRMRRKMKRRPHNHLLLRRESEN